MINLDIQTDPIGLYDEVVYVMDHSSIPESMGIS